jgi:hypothetical protein
MLRLRHGLSLLACLVALVGSSLRASAADAEFVHLWPGWREAESFERIGEFFGGPERPVHRTVIRTRPGARAGYYILLRIKSVAALTSAKFELQVIRPDSPDLKTFTFPVASASAGNTVFDLGLTGEDWPNPKANPVAWKLTLVASDGRALAEHKSFLWEKPAK